jgi:hypothetical protein
MFSSIFRYLRRLLPDSGSKIAALITALLALSLSMYWLINTVQSKWIYGLSHPQQILSYETAASLPSFFGHAFTIGTADSPSTSYSSVRPDWRREDGSYTVAGFHCTTEQDVEFCVPADANGLPLLRPQNAPAGEMDGAAAGLLTLSAFQQWPQQFTPTYDQTLDFVILLLQIDDPVARTVPYVQMASATPQEALALLESGNIQSILAWPAYAVFQYSQVSEVGFSVTRTIRLDGK